MSDPWFNLKNFTPDQLDGKTVYFPRPPKNDYFYGNMHVQSNPSKQVQIDVDYGGPDQTGAIQSGRISLDQGLIDGIAFNKDNSVHSDFVIRLPGPAPSTPADDGWVVTTMRRAQLDGKHVCFSLPPKNEHLYGCFRVQEDKKHPGKLHVAIEYTKPDAKGHNVKNSIVIGQDAFNRIEAIHQYVDFLCI